MQYPQMHEVKNSQFRYAAFCLTSRRAEGIQKTLQLDGECLLFRKKYVMNEEKERL